MILLIKMAAFAKVEGKLLIVFFIDIGHIVGIKLDILIGNDDSSSVKNVARPSWVKEDFGLWRAVISTYLTVGINIPFENHIIIIRLNDNEVYVISHFFLLFGL